MSRRPAPRTASPPRPARTCSSTPTTRWTGTRGARRPSTRARREDRPVLLSVGYSACHWCHVMERESFENDDIAALMNQLFVNIKVDREERPDVDQIYMQAVQSMTGRGGWPMTVFLTPGRRAVLRRHLLPAGGPPRHARLPAAAAAHRGRLPRRGAARCSRPAASSSRRMRQGERLTGVGQRSSPTDVLARRLPGPRPASSTSATAASAQAPKFPQPMTWEALLRVWRRTGDRARARDAAPHPDAAWPAAACTTSSAAASTATRSTAQWLVPHFEKMLYDNAQLASLYLHGWLATGEAEYRRVDRGDPRLRAARDDASGRAASTRPRTPTRRRRGQVLRLVARGDPRGRWATRRSRAPSWPTGAWTTGPTSRATASCSCRASPRRSPRRSAVSRRRAGRPDRARAPDALRARARSACHPGLDDKVLAVLERPHARRRSPRPRRALGRADYLAAAVRNAEFLDHAPWSRDGRLLRSWKDGQARITGYLEDHAMVGRGPARPLRGDLRPALARRVAPARRGGAAPLLERRARDLLRHRRTTRRALVVRPRNLFDNAVPSGTSVTIEWLLRLAIVTGEERYEAIALQALRPMADLMQRYPSGLRPLPLRARLPPGPGGRGGAGLARGRRARRRAARSRRCSAATSRTGWWSAPPAGAPGAAGLPLLADRGAVDGRPTAYVCRRYVCQLPVTEPDALARQLDAGV